MRTFVNVAIKLKKFFAAHVLIMNVQMDGRYRTDKQVWRIQYAPLLIVAGSILITLTHEMHDFPV